MRYLLVNPGLLQGVQSVATLVDSLNRCNFLPDRGGSRRTRGRARRRVRRRVRCDDIGSVIERARAIRADTGADGVALLDAKGRARVWAGRTFEIPFDVPRGIDVVEVLRND